MKVVSAFAVLALCCAVAYAAPMSDDDDGPVIPSYNQADWGLCPPDANSVTGDPCEDTDDCFSCFSPTSPLVANASLSWTAAAAKFGKACPDGTKTCKGRPMFAVQGLKVPKKPLGGADLNVFARFLSLGSPSLNLDDYCVRMVAEKCTPTSANKYCRNPTWEPLFSFGDTITYSLCEALGVLGVCECTADPAAEAACSDLPFATRLSTPNGGIDIPLADSWSNNVVRVGLMLYETSTGTCSNDDDPTCASMCASGADYIR
eukprot:CAMPEP_0197441566 /NCGR_PEP_ID=MMETSP1175-20131217/7807_1 /TAXON_ID=1003142 /ORGANISM="Triceratium dubium, Strain CCMP147" /LENGTH=260 /DNA_ID=CAMNT_0042971863 /DNA_START=10 /DNA_END=792 /DNA_ORIENTATION=-